MTIFGEYLLGEMAKRNQTRREFAAHIHSTHDTLHRYIENGETPTLNFLRNLSSYTGHDLWSLLKKALPDDIPDPDADIIRAANLLKAMPKTKREFFIELIEQANFAISQAKNNESEIRGGKKG